MRQTQSKWDEWSQVSSLLGIQTLNLNLQLECDEWKYVRWQNNERWRAFESQMAKETEMAFFIRPQAHNLHTNRSGVRKCQRRYQNEIIFYHFLLSSNGSQRFTFHCWLFLSSTVGRISRVWVCVCACRIIEHGICLSDVYSVHTPRQNAAHKLKYICSIEECFQQFCWTASMNLMAHQMRVR